MKNWTEIPESLLPKDFCYQVFLKMLLKHKSGTALSSAGSWDILHSRSCPCFSQLTVTQFICTALMDVTTLLEQINISALSPEAVLACKSLPHLSSLWREPHTPILQQRLKFLLSTEGVSLGWDNQGHPVHPNEEFSPTPTHPEPSTSGYIKPDQPNPWMENQNNQHTTEVSAGRRVNNPTTG